MTQNDTAPNLVVQCLNQFGSALNLTGGTATLRMQKPSGTEVSLPIAVDAGTEGYVTHTWLAGELDQAGTYLLKVRTVSSGGAITTVPAYGYIKLYVTEQIEP